MKTKDIVAYIFLFLLTALVLDLANPLFAAPARDGGFFLYAGQQILDGKIPYQDFWDSKGPAIFYINAVGLFLGGGSRWGVWLVEFVFIFCTFYFLRLTLLSIWGDGAALFGTTTAGLSLKLALGYGNYTEEYALLFNIMALYLFLSMTDHETNFCKYLWIGALFGLSFNFRANNIGGLFAIFIAVFLFYAFKQNFIEAIKIAGSILAGFFVPFLLWVFYFAIYDIANEMIYASIIFNFFYSAAQERTWFDILGGFGRYGLGWYGWFTLGAWCAFFMYFLSRFARRKTSVVDIFLLFWFPIEIIVSNLSGRNFTHYYISWVLAIAVYSGFIFAACWQLIFKTAARDSWNHWLSISAAAAAALVLFVLFSPTWLRYRQTIQSEKKEYFDSISAYIEENTQPDDFVLTWYPEMRINFLANRTSPVKYVYYPLFLKGSLTEEIENRYIADLTTHRPELILDCARQVDAIPSLDFTTRQEQYAIPGVKRKMYIQPQMDIIFNFVQENYSIETKIEDCIIFRQTHEQ